MFMSSSLHYMVKYDFITWYLSKKSETIGSYLMMYICCLV